MEITESRRLYQQLAAELKDRIEQGSILSVINFPLSVSLRMKKASAARWSAKPSSCWKWKGMLRYAKVPAFM